MEVRLIPGFFILKFFQYQILELTFFRDFFNLQKRFWTAISNRQCVKCLKLWTVLTLQMLTPGAFKSETFVILSTSFQNINVVFYRKRRSAIIQDECLHRISLIFILSTTTPHILLKQQTKPFFRAIYRNLK